ncbi:hypothetical protein [Nannocystis pusilla]|uniref:hypothetical protein n=1 Tax=Nannocystis pusilla TaxID=889268 RepID=UPI003B809F6D
MLIGSGNKLYVVDFPEEQVTPLSSQVPYDPGAAPSSAIACCSAPPASRGSAPSTSRP